MRHGWPWVLVFLAFVSCAEKKQENKSGWAGFPVPIYSDAEITSTPESTEDFEATLTFWEQNAGRQLFDYRGVWTGGAPFTGTANAVTSILANVVFFLNPWPLDQFTAGQTVAIKTPAGFTGAVIMLNPSISLCGGDCRGDQTRTSRQKLLAHEIGHFIGLGHVADSANIMNPYLPPGGSLEQVGVDRSALQQAMAR